MAISTENLKSEIIEIAAQQGIAISPERLHGVGFTNLKCEADASGMTTVKLTVTAWISPVANSVAGTAPVITVKKTTVASEG